MNERTRLMIGLLMAAIVVAPHDATVADSLAIYPEKIELTGARDYQSIVVQHRDDDGVTHDVTGDAKIQTVGSEVAQLEERRLRPISNGAASLVVTYAGKTVSATLTVRNAGDDPELSLRKDVMPVFMKAGCNAGSCHGAARGKDGFQLSLFGYDPAGDYHRLLDQMPGRRLNLARPEASLLLTKATGVAPHTGGERFDSESPFYEVLRRWIREGARDDPSDVAKPTGIKVYPSESVLAQSDEKQQLTVLATYSDGTDRDVTDLAVFLSNNDNSAAVNAAGLITAGSRGEAFVMARFATFTQGARVIVHDPTQTTPYEETEAYNVIDKIVYDKLRKLRITPSPVAGDEQFLRRVCLDLTGLTPTREQYEQFLSDDRPDKRAQLIDELLETEAFIDVWTMRIGELLRIRTDNQVSYKALLGFHNWVRKQIAQDTPLDSVFRDVLASTGGTFDTPATNYFQIEANTLKLAENVAQTYMGIRVQCAQCHNHPFDRWTMDDYYGFAAFFSQVGFKQSQDPREFIIYDRTVGEVLHFVDQQPVDPEYLGGGAADVDDKSRRVALANWIVSADNPQFARNLANIVWAHHFGRGVIEPVDDVRISNPASNPELLDALASNLAGSSFRLKSLVRTIVNSRTYQLSTKPSESNGDDVANFSRAQVRRIRAEALLDSISQVTQTTDQFPRLPAGARATQIADGAVSNYFLTTFGRAPRETVCACEVDVQPNLSQAFSLLNGDKTNDKVVEGGVVTHLLDAGHEPSEVIEHLYIECLTRRPTSEELAQLLSTIDATSPQEGLEDIFWALLNSKEFIFNH